MVMKLSKPLQIGTANKRIRPGWSSRFFNGRTAREQKEEREKGEFHADPTAQLAVVTVYL